MSPAECFGALWRLCACELAKRQLAERNAPTTPDRKVLYLRPLAPCPLEGGNYAWLRGNPRIALWRSELPENIEQPDHKTNPLRDACVLAHEFGHFLSDFDGSRTQKYYDPLRPHTAHEVLAEEEQAWKLGRETLQNLGCTEFGDFEGERERCLNSYRDGFAAMSTAQTPPR